MVNKIVKTLLSLFNYNTGIYYVSEAIEENVGKLPKSVATYDEAMQVIGFGKFSMIVFLVSIPCSWASIFSPYSLSYAIPEARCDLDLSLLDMGLLNASAYVGMIMSTFMWGFLADKFGRKRSLIVAASLDAFVNICASFSTDKWMLLFFKFISGFISNGPYAILIIYIAEFHSNKYRSTGILLTGIFIGSSAVILPILAWIIMPLKTINIGQLDFHAWQLYIFICGTPSLITSLVFIFLPETPRFLFSQGKQEEALEILRMVYSFNTGKPKDLFPVTNILFEDLNNKKMLNSKNEPKTGLSKEIAQFKEICKPPYLWTILTVICIQFFLYLGSNTFKTWLPQIFTYMDEYGQFNGYNKSATVCEMISFSINNQFKNSTRKLINFNRTEDCVVIPPDNQIYVNSIIVGVCSMLMFGVTSILVNFLSRGTILGILFFLSACSTLFLIWCKNSIGIISLATIYSAQTGVACVTIISVAVDLLPLTYRLIMVSLTMMSGRIGIISGNIISPMLLESGCVINFVFFAAIIAVCLPFLFILFRLHKGLL